MAVAAPTTTMATATSTVTFKLVKRREVRIAGTVFVKGSVGFLGLCGTAPQHCSSSNSRVVPGIRK
ncbi:unnamed protein product [Trichogramma brassicae]|uniref:Uncharacterized protein n=1 Tax=Trichogramma brassicae TaxID=86971 RepID=A0A6H5J4D3_9HYME|nr:unnamed protein product [Trichogramma brassicae]